jgi:CopG family transcriptional regulator / antitoxin EndoAI
MAPKAAARSYERINISLPRSTLTLLDRIASKGNRSRFIDEAIQRFAKSRSRSELRRLLEEDGRVNKERDLAIHVEWAA